MNYCVQPIRDEQGNYHIFPYLDWCWGNASSNCNNFSTFNPQPSSWREKMVQHLTLIANQGFNTIRLVKLEMTYNPPPKGLEVTDGFLSTPFFYDWNIQKPTCPYMKTPGIKVETSEDFNIVGDLIASVINIIREESIDLKVILLTGAHGVENKVYFYGKYLEYLAIRFKNEPIVFAYDLYNEPAYEEKVNHYTTSKIQRANWMAIWYNSIKSKANSQFITYGPPQSDVFLWDFEIMPVDFASYHISSWKARAPNYNVQLAFQKYISELNWFSNSCSKTWIIGETGFSGGYPDTNYPYLGTFEEQSYFVENSLRYSSWFGAIGYSWWYYKNGNFPDWWGIEGKNLGLSYKHNNNDWKQAASHFPNYEWNTECPTCTIPADNQMWNPYNLPHLRVKGTVIDSITNNPIQNAFIYMLFYNPDSTDYKKSLSYSNTQGEYEVYFENSTWDS
jgi:hypothetical protein